MRSALRAAIGEVALPSSAHAALLYERYVPLVYGDEPPPQPDEKLPEVGKVLPEIQERLLKQVAAIPFGQVYRVAWRRWQAALKDSRAVTEVVETTTRILIGHGNPAPSEVGITLHHVYGVPLLPGTALKGLLNHYLATWGAVADARWAGVPYNQDSGQPVGAPGGHHGKIFGIPNLVVGDGRRQLGQAGGVVFEDAWLIPGEEEYPLCPDVLTPHQCDYYRDFGGMNGEKPPNDWTDPNPVSFLSVKPKLRFLLAISPLRAERQGAELAMAHLVDALEQWGIGAKTRAGYGRLRRIANENVAATEKPSATPTSRAAAEAPLVGTLLNLEAAISAVLEPPNREQAPPIAQRLETHLTDELLATLAPEEFVVARYLLKRLGDHAGLKKRRNERLVEIMRKVSQ